MKSSFPEKGNLHFSLKYHSAFVRYTMMLILRYAILHVSDKMCPNIRPSAEKSIFFNTATKMGFKRLWDRFLSLFLIFEKWCCTFLQVVFFLPPELHVIK